MIHIRQASRSFRSASGLTRALKSLDLEIGRGEFLVLTGANGSGKSTLLNIISGSLSLDEGSIFFGAKRIDKFSEHQRSKWISRIFQDPHAGTAADLTVIENFRLASLRTRSKNLKTGIDKKFIGLVRENIALLGLGLENKTAQQMGSLSGGERQALTLVMAVMDKSEILLMDEPTAALDPATAVVLLEKATALIEEKQLTTILVTHNLKEAHKYGNRLIQMKEGSIFRDVNASEKKNLALSDIYAWF